MTIAEKKQYLRKYLSLERDQKKIEEEIEEMRLSFIPSIKLTDMPKGHHISDLSEYAARMDKLFEQLKKILDRKIETRLAIRRSIENMTNETEKTVLVMRYLRGMRFMDIATELSYSESRVWHIHGNALVHFEPERKDHWEY